ncbi:MAG: adenosylmethionine--8-amino-7-oxononanoate transaminase [Candidatus Firestonebacteria bacterium]
MFNLEKEDKKYIWHPFAQMKDYLREKQIIIESGDGVYLKDIHHNKYIDGVSSLWVNLHGHRKKEINDAMIKQIKKISHSTLLGLSNVPSIKLAKELVKIAPAGLKKVFYSDNGSTAVEISLKIAYQYWSLKGKKEKTKFVALKNSYHGDTIGSVSVGGIDLFHMVYKSLLFKTYFAPSPYCYRCEFGKISTSCHMECVLKLEEIVKKYKDKIAGVILEPLIQCAGGMIVQPNGYLKRIREICNKHNVLLILDEVATGFGRTGYMFACEKENVHPDIMAVAKGITGGYLPLAATLTTQEIFNAFSGDYKEKKTFFHGHTYTGNPLCCSAAMANLEIFKKEKILEKLQPKIKLLSKELEKFKELPYVGDVRQCGFIAGIELVKDKKTKKEYKYEEKIGIKVCMNIRKHGLILRPLGNVIVVMSPLSISENELKKMLNIIYNSIVDITGD